MSAPATLRERYLALAVQLAKSPDEAIAIAERFMRWTTSTESGAPAAASTAQGGGLAGVTTAAPDTPSAADAATGDGAGGPPPVSTSAADTLSPTQCAVRAQIEAKQRWTEERVTELIALYREGAALKGLAHKYGMSVAGIYSVLKRLGVAPRNNKSAGDEQGWPAVVARAKLHEPVCRWPDQKRAIITAAWKAGKSYAEIAEEATRSGYPISAGQVCASVAQLGLTNDPDRIAARRVRRA